MTLNGRLRKPLSQLTRTLSDVCMGRAPADVLIRGGRLVNVHTREIQDGVDVAVKAGRVAMFGDAGHTLGRDTEVIDADGSYLVPGLIDTHLHVESTMVTVSRFAEAVLPHGTTTAFIDNHEIANVFGLDGMRWMMEESRSLPLKVFLAIPSCVPSLPGFEDAGATIGPEDVRTALGWDRAAGLGEMMNMPGVTGGDPATHEMIGSVLEARRVVTGHWTLHGAPGHELHAYACAGVDSDHETVRREDALSKLRAGMWVQLREGSAWHDVANLAPVLTEDGVDSRHALIVTDDVDPQALAAHGHLNNAVRTAIAAGLDPLVAIQCATVNAAEYMGMRQDLGSIAPGRCADILFVADLKELRPHFVLADGAPLPASLPAFEYPAAARSSVRIPPLNRADLAVTARGARARVRAIGVNSGEFATEHRVLELDVIDGAVSASVGMDVAKVACIERHGGPGSIGLGFVQGLGLERGAVGTTVAHDCHNLLLVGMDDDDMLMAAGRLTELGGGMIAVADGVTIAEVPLPIAGLMSERSVTEMAEAIDGLLGAYHSLGCRLEQPFMAVSFLALAVVPELRITNRGLVDSRRFEAVDLVASDGR